MADAHLDEEWMDAVCRGDRKAYQSLVHRHSKAISHYAYRLLGSEADAEDVTQETFLRLWINACKWQPDKARLTTWLHRIAHNLCVDLQRKQGRIELQGDEQTLDHPLRETDSNEPNSADQLNSAETHNKQMLRLRQALDGLPENQRSALTLCTFSGFSNQEAAAIMGLSVKALESALARARRTLRETLANEAAL
ncbi:MAG: RNA polymerase sigma factor [Pseudohongiellaceae bacterium]